MIKFHASKRGSILAFAIIGFVSIFGDYIEDFVLGSDFKGIGETITLIDLIFSFGAVICIIAFSWLRAHFEFVAVDVENDLLKHRKGILSRDQLTWRLSDVASLGKSQNIALKILRCQKVTIQNHDGSANDIEIFLNNKNVDKLEMIINQTDKVQNNIEETLENKNVIRIDNKHMLKYVVLNCFEMESLLLYGTVSFITGFVLVRRGLSLYINVSYAHYAIVILLIYLMLSIVYKFLLYNNYELTIKDHEYVIKRGSIVTKEYRINKSIVCGLVETKSHIDRLFNVTSVKVIYNNTDHSQIGSNELFKYISDDYLNKFISNEFSEFKFERATKSPLCSNYFLYIIRKNLILFSIISAIAIYLNNLVAITTITLILIVLSILCAGIIILELYVNKKYFMYTYEDNIIMIGTGNILGQKKYLLTLKSVESIKIRNSIMRNKKGNESKLVLNIIGFNNIIIKNINLAISNEIKRICFERYL